MSSWRGEGSYGEQIIVVNVVEDLQAKTLSVVAEDAQGESGLTYWHCDIYIGNRAGKVMCTSSCSLDDISTPEDPSSMLDQHQCIAICRLRLHLSQVHLPHNAEPHSA